MSFARFAVVAIVAFFNASIVLSAQKDAGTHVTIHVTDIAGAPIPKAQIKIMSPEDGRLLDFTTNSQGVADLDLRPGEYQYRIAYPAFCPKNDITTIDPIWPQEVRAKLQVISCPGPCSPPCVTPVGVEPPGYPVTIKVIDPGRAPVADALVEVDPPSASLPAVKTGGNGQVVIGLPVGSHSLIVSAPGFRRWMGFAEVQGTEEVVTAKLHIADGGCGVCVSPGGAEPGVEHSVPDESIAPEPLGPVALLSHKLRFRGSHHKAS